MSDRGKKTYVTKDGDWRTEDNGREREATSEEVEKTIEKWGSNQSEI